MNEREIERALHRGSEIERHPLARGSAPPRSSSARRARNVTVVSSPTTSSGLGSSFTRSFPPVTSVVPDYMQVGNGPPGDDADGTGGSIVHTSSISKTRRNRLVSILADAGLFVKLTNADVDEVIARVPDALPGGSVHETVMSDTIRMFQVITTIDNELKKVDDMDNDRPTNNDLIEWVRLSTGMLGRLIGNDEQLISETRMIDLLTVEPNDRYKYVYEFVYVLAIRDAVVERAKGSTRQVFGFVDPTKTKNTGRTALGVSITDGVRTVMNTPTVTIDGRRIPSEIASARTASENIDLTVVRRFVSRLMPFDLFLRKLIGRTTRNALAYSTILSQMHLGPGTQKWDEDIASDVNRRWTSHLLGSNPTIESVDKWLHQDDNLSWLINDNNRLMALFDTVTTAIIEQMTLYADGHSPPPPVYVIVTDRVAAWYVDRAFDAAMITTPQSYTRTGTTLRSHIQHTSSLDAALRRFGELEYVPPTRTRQGHIRKTARATGRRGRLSTRDWVGVGTSSSSRYTDARRLRPTAGFRM